MSPSPLPPPPTPPTLPPGKCTFGAYFSLLAVNGPLPTELNFREKTDSMHAETKVLIYNVYGSSVVSEATSVPSLQFSKPKRKSKERK